MHDFDLVLRNARVLTSASDTISDIGIRDGCISALGNVIGTAREEADCTGRVITPGGVDAHCHIEQMSGMGLMNADTFNSATRSAILGGTTTVISFCAQGAEQKLISAMDSYSACAKRGALSDYAFHIIVSDLTAPDAENDLRALVRNGHRSIKVFTTYAIALQDRGICEVLSIAKEEGALVCVHAENDGLIGWTKDRLLKSGKTRPVHHAISHPRLAEIEAVGRLIAFAEFFATPVMLFHLSTAESVAAVRAAKARGVPVWSETCPHYLFMDGGILDKPGMEGAKWMCSPPQRTLKDQKALWDGLQDGTLSVVSSDHAPYRYDASGKLAAGSSPTFAEIANGMPGLETRLPLMFDAIVTQGKLPACDFVRLTASEPARIHGLPGKGDIAEGFDADLVIWDPSKAVTFEGDDLHDNTGYNPWEGRSVTGWPETVFLRGECVASCGKLTSTAGKGHWLNRPQMGVTSEVEASKEYTEATS